MKWQLSDFKDIPPLPEAVAGILRAMEDPNVSAKDVTEMISHDVSISSKLLKVVNSAFYGYKGNITSVTQAVIMLGFNSVKSLVLGLSTCELLNRAKAIDGFSVKDFWRHSVAVACGSKVIAKRLGLKAEEEYFTYGLLHDVGKLVLSVIAPSVFAQIVTLSRSKSIPFYLAESKLSCISHTEIGAQLFKLWKMPESLVSVIEGHHNLLSFNNREELFVVGISNLLIKSLGEGDSGDGNAVDVSQDELRGLLNGRGVNIEGLFDEIHQELKGSSVFLDLVEGK